MDAKSVCTALFFCLILKRRKEWKKNKSYPRWLRSLEKPVCRSVQFQATWKVTSRLMALSQTMRIGRNMWGF